MAGWGLPLSFLLQADFRASANWGETSPAVRLVGPWPEKRSGFAAARTTLETEALYVRPYFP